MRLATGKAVYATSGLIKIVVLLSILQFQIPRSISNISSGLQFITADQKAQSKTKQALPRAPRRKIILT